MTNERDANPLDALRRSVADDERLDPVTTDRLESRLRIAHAQANRSSAVRWWRPALAAPIAVLVVVALSLAVVLRSSDPAAALVVTDAENVTVRLPDGSFVVDPADGYELPDGAVVEIGIGGMVTVDDVLLDTAGTLAVRDGRLVVDVVATTTTPDRPDHLAPDPTTTEPPADVVTTTTAPPTTSAAPETTRPPEPADTTTTTARPDRDGREDERDRSENRDGRDDQREADATEPAVVDEPVDAPITIGISLDLDRVDGGVRVGWAVDGLQPGWNVVVMRTIGDSEPTVVVATADASGNVIDQPTRDDGRPADRRARYRVIVLDEAGGEVASGPAQSLR